MSQNMSPQNARTTVNWKNSIKRDKTKEKKLSPLSCETQDSSRSETTCTIFPSSL